MTVTTPGRTRMCVTVEMDAQPAATGDVVLAAVLQCFTSADPVEIAIFLRDVAEPTQAHAESVLARCHAVCAVPAAMPDVVLLSRGETPDHPVVLELDQTGVLVADVRSVVLVAALAREVWGEDGTPSREASAAVPDPRPAPLTLRDAKLGGTGELRPPTAGDAAELAALLSRLTEAGPQA